MTGLLRLLSWLLSAAAWVGAVACAVWAALRVLGLEWGYPAIQLMAFTPYVTVFALLGALLCAALKRRGAAVVALVASTALAVCVAPRVISDADKPGAGTTLRVLSANLLVGGADARGIVDLVRRTNADLVAFQEFTEDAERRLKEAGLTALLPHTSLHPLAGSHGSALYSRYAMKDTGVRRHGSGFSQAKGELTIDGVGTVPVESVHPCAPTSSDRDSCWFADLADQPKPGGTSLLLGDFNATLDHAPLRNLLDTGYRDVAELLGDGLRPTWPSDRWPPGVTIDRVLIGPKIGVRKYEVHPIPGSDHRAVFAELVLQKTRT